MITTPRWRTLNLCTAILPVEAQRLRELAKDATVLEVGSANGYSAIVMALAGAIHVTSIDYHIPTWLGDTYSTMQENLEAFGVSDKVTMIKQPSADAMREMIKEGRKFAFVFLDGSHLREENEVDIGLALQLVADGGTLARHDYGHADYPQFKEVLDKWFPNGPDRLTNSLFEVKL